MRYVHEAIFRITDRITEVERPHHFVSAVLGGDTFRKQENQLSTVQTGSENTRECACALTITRHEVR